MDFAKLNDRPFLQSEAVIDRQLSGKSEGVFQDVVRHKAADTRVNVPPENINNVRSGFFVLPVCE